MSAIVPAPKTAIDIRLATSADLPFIDRLQKMQTKMVGWMPTRQLGGKIEAGHVLLAGAAEGNPLGYVIAQDQYFKRDDCGIIYQLNVAPGERRKLIGAMLIKAVFDRAAYGCRLFCCWCAQDIEANFFWESIGFVPLAFRTGSRNKQRVHIFWQRRIREGDTTTPYWFPAQTKGGSIREDRLVLPIPPGRRWSDPMPVLLPTAGVLPREMPELETATPKQIGKPALRPPKDRKSDQPSARPASPNAGPTQLRGWGFVPPPAEQPAPSLKTKPQREKVKNDPRHVAAARELRDRWLEEVNGAELIIAQAKYQVSRQLPGARCSASATETPLLPAPSFRSAA